MRNKVFAPWRGDYQAGCVWCVCGMSSSWSLLWSSWYWLSTALALWATWHGWLRISYGLARERGIEVERRAVEAFYATAMDKCARIVADLRLMKFGICVGNVDLLVLPVWTTVSFCVEIKSYSGIVNRWYGLCRLGKYYRLWSPQKQVRGQCRFLDKSWHFPVLWLPESKLDDWFVRNGVLVVNGDVHRLLEGLQAFDRRISKPVIVRFPYAPGDATTGFLKMRGFKYDGTQWLGKVDSFYKDALEQMFKENRATIWWVKKSV